MGDLVERRKSFELLYVKVQEVHRFEEFRLQSGQHAWGGLSHCFGAGPVMQRFMGDHRHAKAVVPPGRQWLNNPIYTPPEQPPPVDNICVMEWPLRTVAKHLSRVSSQSIDRASVASPAASSSVDDSVRVTGDQGLVWSSNPVFAEDCLPGHSYSETRRSSRPPSRLQESRIPSRRASRSSRISSAFELERMPLPRIRTNHERDLTEDSAKNMAPYAMSSVSPVVSGFFSARSGSRDFDSACQNYPTTSEWLNPEVARPERPRMVDRGVQTGPDRDSCMDDLAHDFSRQDVPIVQKLKAKAKEMESKASGSMSLLPRSAASGLEKPAQPKVGKTGQERKERPKDSDSLLDILSTSGPARQNKQLSFSEALSEIHKLRDMIQQQDLEIAALYQAVAQEVSALAKAGKSTATPHINASPRTATPRILQPWLDSPPVHRRPRHVSKCRFPQQDSLEGDTLSRLEVQVQVLSEQLEGLEDKFHGSSGQANAGHKRDSSIESSEANTVIINAGSADLDSEDTDIAGYEVVVNPFFEGHKSPMYCAISIDETPVYDLPFYGCLSAQDSCWAQQGPVNSVVTLQQLIAESDAEIARLSAELEGSAQNQFQGFCPGMSTNQNRNMRGNPVFDSYSPYGPCVVVG